jgi:hypothetical protein
LTVLVYISLVSLVIAVLIAIPFPSVKKQSATRVQIKVFLFSVFLVTCKEMWKDVLKTYKTTNVAKYTLWGGMWLAMHHLVLTYWQSLFYEINKAEGDLKQFQ